MPIIEITLVEGRTEDALRKFADAVTRAAEQCLGAPTASVRVAYHQVAPTHFFIGGKSYLDTQRFPITGSPTS